VLVCGAVGLFGLLQLMTCDLPDFTGRKLLDGVDDRDIIGYDIEGENSMTVVNPDAVKGFTRLLRESRGRAVLRQPASDMAYGITVVTHKEARRIAFPTQGGENTFGKAVAEFLATSPPAVTKEDEARYQKFYETKRKVMERYIP
jgi:hypothetical protein